MADSESPAEARKSEGGHPRLARSAGVFGLATITSRILGLVRDQVLAYYFGAGDANDAFRVASRIPNLVRDLFAEGAMSAAFVPTFTRQLTLHGRERAWHLASSVINALLIVTGVDRRCSASSSPSRWCGCSRRSSARCPARSS